MLVSERIDIDVTIAITFTRFIALAVALALALAVVFNVTLTLALALGITHALAFVLSDIHPLPRCFSAGSPLCVFISMRRISSCRLPWRFLLLCQRRADRLPRMRSWQRCVRHISAW